MLKKLNIPHEPPTLLGLGNLKELMKNPDCVSIIAMSKMNDSRPVETFLGQFFFMKVTNVTV